MPKTLAYVHCPPRMFTDQFEPYLHRFPKIFWPILKLFRAWIIREFRANFDYIDYRIANAENIKNRLQKYVNLSVDEVVWPPIQTNKFHFLGQTFPKNGANNLETEEENSFAEKPYFISYCRLEKLKRIDLIVEAFATIPEKNLVICSGGPLGFWIEEQIATRNLKNIRFEGRVSQERLVELVGNCLAGVYIPINEDAGITQVEIMAAGKPVVAAREGGLLETIVDGETGFFLETEELGEEQIIQNLMQAVRQVTPEKALEMREKCEKRAKIFDEEVFFAKIETQVLRLLEA